MKISQAANLWLYKLDPHSSFSDADRRQVMGAVSYVRAVSARQFLEREGERRTNAIVPLSAFLSRSKQTAGGRRQIFSFALPGDLLGDDYKLYDEMDYSVEVSSAGWVAMVPLRTLNVIAQSNDRLRLALHRATLQDLAIMREWVVNLGTRAGRARLAHLFCEIVWRLSAARLVVDNSCRIPLSQETLANATGMSPVHCNRSLQWLRHQGLLRFDNGVLHILDIAKLNQIAEFDASYLQRAHTAEFVEGHDPRPQENSLVGR